MMTHRADLKRWILDGKQRCRKEGIVKTTDGRTRIFIPKHPNADKQGYVLEYRLVVEKRLNRLLRRDEVVHHINKNLDDNSDENLNLTSQSEHMKEHTKRSCDIIVKMYIDGKTVKEISEETDTKEDTVRATLHRRNISLRITDRRKKIGDEVKKFYQDGNSMSECSKKFGLRISSVRAFLIVREVIKVDWYKSKDEVN